MGRRAANSNEKLEPITPINRPGKCFEMSRIQQAYGGGGPTSTDVRRPLREIAMPAVLGDERGQPCVPGRASGGAMTRSDHACARYADASPKTPPHFPTAPARIH